MRTALAAALLVASAWAAPDAGFVNEKIERRIDLTSQTARVQHTITARSPSGLSKYRVQLSAEERQHMSLFSARDSADNKLAYEIADDGCVVGCWCAMLWDRAGVLTTWHDSEIVVKLASAASASTTFKVSYILTHPFVPLPAEIEQSETQRVVYETNLFLGTPYATTSATAVFKLPTSRIESFTDSEAVKPVNKDTSSSKRDATITYGPYSNVDPDDARVVRLHFEHPDTFQTFRSVNRDVAVSHWGSVHVEEHYELHNTGAKLATGFSRVDFQLGGAPNSFRQITAELPAGAHDVHFRDIIGNISSSHLRPGLKSVTLEVEQRFPLFGGWKTEFYQTYNLPSEGYLFTDAATGQFVLRIPAHVPYREQVIDSYSLKVVLPEGAEVVSVESPAALPMRRLADSRRFTYLDTVLAGRPVVVLEASNLVKAHAGTLEVRYTVPAGAMVREPAMLFLVLLAIFLTYSILSRMDFSITSRVVTKPKRD